MEMRKCSSFVDHQSASPSLNSSSLRRSGVLAGRENRENLHLLEILMLSVLVQVTTAGPIMWQRNTGSTLVLFHFPITAADSGESLSVLEVMTQNEFLSSKS